MSQQRFMSQEDLVRFMELDDLFKEVMHARAKVLAELRNIQSWSPDVGFEAKDSVVTVYGEQHASGGYFEPMSIAFPLEYLWREDWRELEEAALKHAEEVREQERAQRDQLQTDEAVRKDRLLLHSLANRYPHEIKKLLKYMPKLSTEPSSEEPKLQGVLLAVSDICTTFGMSPQAVLKLLDNRKRPT